MRRIRVLAVAALLLLPASAQADPVVNGVFDIPGAPGVQTNGQLTVGADGNVWVALDTAIAKVTPDGTVTVFGSAQLGNALGTPTGGITSAGGFIWVSQQPSMGQEALVKFDPANPAGATGQAVTGVTGGATALTLGPDGNVWVGLANKLVKFSPSNPATTTTYPIGGLSPKAITASTDGTLWVTDNVNGQLLNVKTDGTSTPYTVGGGPQFVGAGPNGQIAFGNPNSAPQAIGLLSPGGTPLTLNRPNGSDPFGVAFGGDGAFWIAEFAGNRLARVTTDGQLTTLTGFPAVAGQGPRQIVAGPGNTLWATLDKPGDAPNSKIARITGVELPPAPPPPVENPPVETPPTTTETPAPDKTAPVLTLVSLSAGTLRFTSSEAGTVRVVVSRKAVGKRSRGRCVKPTKKLRKAKGCTRLVRVRTLSAAVIAGKNSVRIPTGKLAAGRYTVTVRVTDAAGNESKPSNKAFTVKRKRA